jgi:hypothetical protein
MYFTFGKINKTAMPTITGQYPGTPEPNTAKAECPICGFVRQLTGTCSNSTHSVECCSKCEDIYHLCDCGESTEKENARCKECQAYYEEFQTFNQNQ